jgi:hypothetical protein
MPEISDLSKASVRAPLWDAQHLFRKYALRFGPKDLLVIVPYDATLAVGSKVRPENRGKVPGVRRPDGTWTGMRWSAEFEATIEQVKEWSQWPGAGVGLQARNLLGLDIDVNDATVADQVEALARDYLGFAPVRLRDGSPRRLLVYRRAKDHPPIRKMRLAWRDAAGNRHAAELLAAGQYWNAEGIHPSGARYTWRNNESPVEWGANNLTAIDDAALRRFFNGAA